MPANQKTKNKTQNTQNTRWIDVHDPRRLQARRREMGPGDLGLLLVAQVHMHSRVGVRRQASCRHVHFPGPDRKRRSPFARPPVRGWLHPKVREALSRLHVEPDAAVRCFLLRRFQLRHPGRRRVVFPLRHPGRRRVVFSLRHPGRRRVVFPLQHPGRRRVCATGTPRVRRFPELLPPVREAAVAAAGAPAALLEREAELLHWTVLAGTGFVHSAL